MVGNLILKQFRGVGKDVKLSPYCECGEDRYLSLDICEI